MLLTLLLLVACEPTAPEPILGPCEIGPDELKSVELSHYGDYGAIGSVIYCGIPPQGGAAYAPFGVRILGIAPDDLGIDLTMVAIDVDTGEEVGSGDYIHQMVCSNVGDSEGHWVGAELHMRFYGYELDDLHDRTVTVTVEARNESGDNAMVELQATLDCDPLT
jgi:hypothetical protein